VTQPQFWTPRPTGAFPWLRAVVTTRSGGTSAGRYASLNLGLGTGDDAERVAANRARVRAALGLDSVHVLHQVHGTRVWEVPDPAAREGDALWTRAAGVALGVGVADCVPAFAWDARRRWVALVHAGWRGTAAGVLEGALATLREAGSRPEDLHVALGPSIGPCCYRVGAEVASHFPAAAVQTAGETLRLDLRAANRLQAEAAGLPPEHIDAAPPCTGCAPSTFFSHRVEGGRTGRMWALVWADPTAI
jgi:YfiH family protein